MYYPPMKMHIRKINVNPNYKKIINMCTFLPKVPIMPVYLA